MYIMAPEPITSFTASKIDEAKPYYCLTALVKDCQNTRTDSLGERMGLSITLVSSYNSLGQAFLLFLDREFK
jgi:hypothetical protein